MTFRLKTTDCSILECLAEHRILTVSQVAAVYVAYFYESGIVQRYLDSKI
jgi:hypothetical protein